MQLALLPFAMCVSAVSARLLPVSSETVARVPVRPLLAICPPPPAELEGSAELEAGAAPAVAAEPEGSAPALPASFDTRAEVLAMVPALRRRAWRWTRNETEAEDLVQETLLRALVSDPSYASREHLRAWLYTVLRNLFISRRRRDRSAERGLADLAVAGWAAPHPASGAPFLTRSLERALAALPEPFSRVVRLVDLEDYSYGDAATALGVPIGTVMSRLFRGRKRLALELSATMA
jgi:RNA polymerase sigma-70 factor (ECF subfamily)